MKKSLLTVSFVFCIVIATSVAHATSYDIDFSANNWINPLDGIMQTNTAYDFPSTTGKDEYETNFGVQHTGVDIEADLDSPVYAIADGVVNDVLHGSDVRCSKPNEAYFCNVSAIYIRHSTSNRTTFTAIYGHCKAAVKKGDVVYAGQHIGNVVQYNYPNHLHFGININTSPPAKWGQLSKGVDVLAQGWRDPSIFLSENYPFSSENVKADNFFDLMEYLFREYFPPPSSSNGTLKGVSDHRAVYWRNYSNGSGIGVYKNIMWYNLFGYGWTNSGLTIEQCYSMVGY